MFNTKHFMYVTDSPAESQRLSNQDGEWSQGYLQLLKMKTKNKNNLLISCLILKYMYCIVLKKKKIIKIKSGRIYIII